MAVVNQVGFPSNQTTVVFGSSIGEVISISGPGISRTAVDVTHLTSTQNYHEFIPGTIDSGEVTCEMNLDADATIPIEAAAGTLVITWFDGMDTTSMVWSGVTTWSASAFCTGYEVNAPADDRVTVSIKFKLTGEITIGP